MKFRVDFGYETLYNFNKLLYELDDLNFKEILSTEITYYEFKERNGVHSFLSQKVRINEGMKKYLNSIWI